MLAVPIVHRALVVPGYGPVVPLPCYVGVSQLSDAIGVGPFCCALCAMSATVDDGKSLFQFLIELRQFILGILSEYFYSWRPYKLILLRLQIIHGLRRRYVLNTMQRLHFHMAKCIERPTYTSRREAMGLPCGSDST